VLEAAGLIDRFTCVVDGNVAADRGLPGKPAPDTFVAAAADLGIAVADCVVMEDALSGVEAGKAGGFGLVVGVDRGAGADRLRQSGADLVVSDLGELVTA
jgi:beta-phosphoglucomutase-like phosphatase (HAD superfamily)